MSGFDMNDFNDQADLLGVLQRQQQARELRGLRDQLEQNNSLPQCPYCGGRLEGQFEKCMHCRSDLAWVERIPCKPGEEEKVRRELKAHRDFHLEREAETQGLRQPIIEERSKHHETDIRAAKLYVLGWGVGSALTGVLLAPLICGVSGAGSEFVGPLILMWAVMMGPFGALMGWFGVRDDLKAELDVNEQLPNKFGIGWYLEWRNSFRRRGSSMQSEETTDEGYQTETDSRDDLSPSLVTNSMGMQFVLCPAGEFMMGSPDTEMGRDDNETQHPARITEPFYLGVTQVTQEQYERVTGVNPSEFDAALITAKTEKTGVFLDVIACPENPVEQVSWDDAVAFCERLSALPAEKTADRQYRLPTEAEWEWACRAGTTTAYEFGDDESELAEYGWFVGNPGPTTTPTEPVGTRKSNAWGLNDMHGNVYEWCQDRYGDYPSAAVTDPTGPASGSNRVIRGGSWSNYPQHCRSAHRYGEPPEIRDNNVGFRVVCNSIK